VAAFLLARGDAIDRRQAERDAKEYYDTRDDDADANDVLDPRAIRAWLESRRAQPARRPRLVEEEYEATLERPRADYLARRLSVLPLSEGDAIVWLDPAGYTVARSALPADFEDRAANYQFELSVETATVRAEPYLPHR
jgi:hypothetical protein